MLRIASRSVEYQGAFIEKLRTSPEDPDLKKGLKVTDRAFKQMNDDGLQNFFHELAIKTAEFVAGRTEGLYRHATSLELEG